MGSEGCSLKSWTPFGNSFPALSLAGMALKLHVIICSTRPGRVGPSVARWFHDFAVQHGRFDASLVDLADFDLPIFDEPNHPATGKYTRNTRSAGARASHPPTPTSS